mgnify:CR=1 FL=1
MMEKRWLLCDFHIHTTISDGVLDLMSLIDFYGSRGFDVISITEHLHEESILKSEVEEDKATYSLGRDTFDRYLEDLRRAARYAWREYEMLLIPGVELSNDTRSYHILVIDVKRYIDPALPVEEIIFQAREQGALTIAAHPCRRQGGWNGTSLLWREHKRYGRIIDAWEAANRREIYADVISSGYKFIGCSDFHKPDHIYSWKTLLYAEKSVDSVKEAIRRGYTALHFYGEDIERRALKSSPARVR